VSLITASILSKKLAAGLQFLVMDVKVGNGAFSADAAAARELAASLVDVAGAAGLPTQALITDMNQVLGSTAGNALEVRESIDFLTGAAQEPRLLELTVALAARMLQMSGLAATLGSAESMARDALASGRAAERFERMVAGLGGPRDLAGARAALPSAPMQCKLVASREGVLAAMDTRAIGMAVVALGGGRRKASDAVDPRVGISALQPLGTPVRAGDVLLQVHAADEDAAREALRAIDAALTIADTIGDTPGRVSPLVIDGIPAP